MSDSSDFRIVWGELQKYFGPGGDVKLPDEVTKIGVDAFYDCSRLKSITIPASVIQIESQAFWGCRNLEKVTLLSDKTQISPYAFYHCEKLADHDGLVVVGDILFEYYGPGGNVVVPDGIKCIKSFSGNKKIKKIDLPESVTEICRDAFNGCSGLTSIRIPKGVTSLEQNTFVGCSKLKSLLIDNEKCVIQMEVFSTFPSGLIDSVYFLYPHMTDGALKQYVIEKTWNKLSIELQTRIFLERQSKMLLKAYWKSIADERIEPMGEEILRQMEHPLSVSAYNAVATYMKQYYAKASSALLQRLYEKLKEEKNAIKAYKLIEASPEVKERLSRETKEAITDSLSLVFKDILSQLQLSVQDIKLRLEDYYGLKEKDLPTLIAKSGNNVDASVLMYLLSVHETKKTFRSGKQDVISCYDQPGISTNASRIVAELQEESLQAAIL